MAEKTKLTTKQQRFVDFYDGNATDAARKAGYKGNDNTLGQVGDENLKKPKIAAAIRNREKKRNNPLIASREQRQEFWTKTMFFDVRKLLSDDGTVLNINKLDDETAKLIQGFKVTDTLIMGGEDDDDKKLLNRKIEYKLTDKLKASELLGRSEADFTDKIEANVNHEISGKLDKALKLKDKHGSSRKK